jgi:Uncharacterized proteins, LmbE homologs
MKNILVVGAHYDDAELGAGGIMTKLGQEGKRVYKLTLTDNETHFKEKNIEVDKDSSLAMSNKACKILGVTELDFPPKKCNYLKYSTEIMQQVEHVIYEYDIDTLFCHYRYDVNKDHVAAAEICLTAGRHCTNVLAFQSNAYILEHSYYPTLFFDISDVIEMKRQAMFQYEGDHNRYGRLFDTVIERNHIWGFYNNVGYAEGFHVVKMRL